MFYMNRELHDSQAKAVLPPGFWSQAPSDQLHRLEQLLQQFLSLPGFQQGTGHVPPQPEAGWKVTPNYPGEAASHSPATAGTGASANAGWAPSGSTWGPLAEVWKQVQGEKQSLVPRAEPAPSRFSAPGNQNPSPAQEVAENIAWHFPSDPAEPFASIPAWHLGGHDAGGSRPKSDPVQETLRASEEFPSFNTTPADSKANLPGTEKASIPVQAGWAHRTLVVGNRVVDSGLRRLGWPGRGLQSSLGKWILGLAGVCLLTGGTWLYFREAVDELAGQIGFGETAPR